MSSALYEGREKEFERAFEHEFIPDTYELINVYKLYEDIDYDSLSNMGSENVSPAYGQSNAKRRSSLEDPDSEFFRSKGYAGKQGCT